MPPKSPEKVDVVESPRETSSEDYKEQEPKYLKYGHWDYNYWSDYSRDMDVPEHPGSSVATESSRSSEIQKIRGQEEIEEFDESLEGKIKESEKEADKVMPVKKVIDKIKLVFSCFIRKILIIFFFLQKKKCKRRIICPGYLKQLKREAALKPTQKCKVNI